MIRFAALACLLAALAAPPAGADAEQIVDAGDDPRYPVDAMVGQVNGRPIFARRVLAPLSEDLARLGEQLPQPIFREQAAELIAGRLDQIVTEALILAEAERDLTRRERQGVAHMVREQERELIRRHGRGSRALADATLLERTGQNLQQTLREFREEIIVREHMRKHLHPRINVTRRHIQRHYEQHRETYHPPARRTLRVILVGDATEAAAVTERLDAGEPFADIAADESLNAYRPHDAGELTVTGDNSLAHAALNDALAELDPGEHVGPIAGGESYWFLALEEIEQPPSRTLREAQLEIQHRLRREQFDRLSRNYRQQLYETGSYNPIPEMADALLEIAVTRYANQAGNSHR